VLVASKDVAAFRRFAGPRREIIDEADILPGWLRRFPDPFSFMRRDVWLSLRTAPMRGWHVQQLRRFAIAAAISEDAVLNCDSDVAFVAPFDAGSGWQGGDLRLYRRDNALNQPGAEEQRLWSANAARCLGLPGGSGPHDYINTLIEWRTDSVRAMLARIEANSGRHWVAAIGKDRTFSECMIYGRHADDVEKLVGHYVSSESKCRVYWTGPALDRAGIRDFIASRAPHQVAVGLQSFVGMDLSDIRAVLEGR
jgi:hypothetical protein